MHKVLIVDDESWVLESFKDFIDWADYGFEIVGQAQNGAEALEAIRTHRPDVVFTDVRMPEMNGLELIQRGKSLPFPVHFVIVSGYAEFAYAQKALQHGALAYCLKPYDEMEIALVLAKIKKTLEAAKPASDSLLIQLLEEPDAENRLKLQELFMKHDIRDWRTEGIVAIVTIGQGELPDLRECGIRIRTGTSKTAHLLGSKQAETRMRRWKEGLPAGMKGIGISEPTTDLKNILHAVEEADVLAHQFFVSGGNGPFYPKSFKQNELNELMKEMSGALRDKDGIAVYRSLDRIGAMFKEGSLTVRHAFQVYTMTVSSLFNLGQQENILYGYEQLIGGFGHVNAMLGELKTLLNRYLRNSEPLSAETRNQTFNSILQFVRHNFHQDLSLQTLSEQFFMNPSYISQLFRKETGETFTSYLAKLRIAYACELLKREEGSISDIAEKTGYHDYFYFTRLFKKITGKTPGQYRNSKNMDSDMNGF